MSSKSASTNGAKEDVPVTGALDTATVTALQGALAVPATGVLDTATVTALQEVAGLPATGYVHNQGELAEHVGAVSPLAWRYTGFQPTGDDTIRFLQSKLEVKPTGLLDTATVTALQVALSKGLEWQK